MNEETPIYELTLIDNRPDHAERQLSDQVITESLNAAYATLAAARKAACDAVETEALSVFALEESENRHLLAGAIDGKNEKLRDAQMFNRTEVERTNLYTARSARRRAELDLQLAQDEVQRLRAIVSLITSQN